VQANIVQDIFNRQQSLAVAQAKENARGAALDVAGKRDEVVFRTASLYLDAERASRLEEFARRQSGSLQKVLETVQTQVREGRALPLAEKTVAANLAHARQAAELLDDAAASSETALAMALGFSAEDRVHPVVEERPAPPLPKSEEEAIASALDSNKDLRKLESQITAKELEKRGVKAQRLPRVDLVAQYALLAKFNNYAEFFQKYQQNNEQIGMSFQMPFALGPGVGAQVAQVESDIAHLKVDLNSRRFAMCTSRKPPLKSPGSIWMWRASNSPSTWRRCRKAVSCCARWKKRVSPRATSGWPFMTRNTAWNARGWASSA
jgi:outer membrane protein TolC